MSKLFAAKDVPPGYRPMGSVGRAVNVCAANKEAYRIDLARQRYVWNHFLALQMDQYRITGQFIFFAEMSRQLTMLRHSNLWIGAGGFGGQQRTLRHLERALIDSFPSAGKDGGKRKRFPKFRKLEDRRDTLTVPAEKLRVSYDASGCVTHIGFPKLPLLRVRGLTLTRGCRITSGTVAFDGRGMRVSLSFIAPLPKPVEPQRESIGVDVGLGRLAQLSNGEAIRNPKPLKKAAKKLRRAQRKLARRRKGSVNRRRSAKIVASIHARVANIRKNGLHKASRHIVDMAGLVCVEGMFLNGLARTRMAGSIYDAGIGELLRQIAYKADWAGRRFYEHPRYARSTGCCPDCRMVGRRLKLSERHWTCEECGQEHDRDLAASRWIELIGRETIGLVDTTMVGRRAPEPTSSKSKRGFAGGRKSGSSDPNADAGSPANVSRRIDRRSSKRNNSSANLGVSFKKVDSA